MSDATYIRWAAERLNVPDSISRKVWSSQNSTVYEIASWFLKIGGSLAPECERLRWLRGRLPVPEVVEFTTLDGKDVLVTTAVAGAHLSALKRRLPAENIVEMLASALCAFHAADASECPFKASMPGNVLVHGDACLPNIVFRDDGALSGFIDLGDMGAGDAEVDLSAAVWSLQYNLGPGHGLEFLRAYGLTAASHDDVDRLRTMYESRD
jgi:aminoglycoside phosphotransferase